MLKEKYVQLLLLCLPLTLLVQSSKINNCSDHYLALYYHSDFDIIENCGVNE